ncbi:MAG: thioredoxin, partial [Candidatus Dormibacteraeota bacterium]|nr:thioredoxin [Candidatus Dormibacteraeota bacterium]
MIDVSEDELERTLRQEERLVLVDFWHPSCEPCRELRQQLEALNEEACLLLALDASRHPLAAARHRVSDFPAVIFF